LTQQQDLGNGGVWLNRAAVVVVALAWRIRLWCLALGGT
jgi:hypothetical protein